jgi:hypothetical protein
LLPDRTAYGAVVHPLFMIVSACVLASVRRTYHQFPKRPGMTIILARYSTSAAASTPRSHREIRLTSSRHRRRTNMGKHERGPDLFRQPVEVGVTPRLRGELSAAWRNVGGAGRTGWIDLNTHGRSRSSASARSRTATSALPHLEAVGSRGTGDGEVGAVLESSFASYHPIERSVSMNPITRRGTHRFQTRLH